MVDILVTNGPGDFGNVECCRQQEPLRQLDATGNDVLMRRKAHAGFETSRKMKGAEVNESSQLLEGYLPAKIGFDEIANRADGCLAHFAAIQFGLWQLNSAVLDQQSPRQEMSQAVGLNIAEGFPGYAVRLKRERCQEKSDVGN